MSPRRCFQILGNRITEVHGRLSHLSGCTHAWCGSQLKGLYKGAFLMLLLSGKPEARFSGCNPSQITSPFALQIITQPVAESSLLSVCSSGKRNPSHCASTKKDESTPRWQEREARLGFSDRLSQYREIPATDAEAEAGRCSRDSASYSTAVSCCSRAWRGVHSSLA